MQQTMNELSGFKDLVALHADRALVVLAVVGSLMLSAWIGSVMLADALAPNIML